MRKIIGFFAAVFIVAFIVTFAWRILAMLGAPIGDYDFSTIFSNTAWAFGLIYGLYKIMPKARNST